MDNVSPQVRSRIMSSVRHRDTEAEMIVRSLAHRLGLRFRLCDANLPGTPDLVFRRHRVAMFVHGCFWHHHRCARGTVPKTRSDYWSAKFARNQARDRQNRSDLRREGWRVVVIWECETKNPERLKHRLRRLFGIT